MNQNTNTYQWNRVLPALLLFVFIVSGCKLWQEANATNPRVAEQQIRKLLRTYEAGLNQSDVNGIISLYASDAVFMAQHRTPSVGHRKIKAAYRSIFGIIRLKIAFQIDEVVVVNPTFAYARTRSAGQTTILANGAKVKESNQELFLFRRKGNRWKIFRYIFSTMNPLPIPKKNPR
ncbi:MAG: nuclear transport factor 2 family protein [Deltaproteobacteria bacterium]|nr:MAG: nuclear transport factor 2 family protein [Deltaproteobacteria bacterium]